MPLSWSWFAVISTQTEPYKALIQISVWHCVVHLLNFFSSSESPNAQVFLMSVSLVSLMPSDHLSDKYVFVFFYDTFFMLSDTNPVCGANEEFLSCGIACAPTCAQPIPQECDLACSMGCFCKSGFVRDSASNQCVTLDKCPTGESITVA